MRYKVNARCTKCGVAFSYWNDGPAACKVCPFDSEPDHWPTEREMVASPKSLRVQKREWYQTHSEPWPGP